MTKLDQLRALRERQNRKPARVASPKPAPAPRKPKAAKPRQRASRAVSTPGPSFDRTAYQRVYCRLNRRHGPVADWPPEAVAELRTYSTGTRGRKKKENGA